MPRLICFTWNIVPRGTFTFFVKPFYILCKEKFLFFLLFLLDKFPPFLVIYEALKVIRLLLKREVVMAKKSKVNVFVEALRSISYDLDRDALSRLGLDWPVDQPIDDALLSDLHQFESSAAKVLLAIDIVKINRFFG